MFILGKWALFCPKYADYRKKKIPEMFNFQGFTKSEVFKKWCRQQPKTGWYGTIFQ
jgi:hypothetical protein